ncbi:MAG: acyltransferase family protein, partial [Planctomycetota bacterium]
RPESQTRPVSGARMRQLDGLRGVAAIFVMLMHYTVAYDNLIGHQTPMLLKFPRGGIGVHVFFMLSGFVIFMSLDRARNLLDFIVSRFARLYPAYWTALLITLLVTFRDRIPGYELSGKAIMANFTMIQGFLGFMDIDPVYWTLQAELQFYVLMGLIFGLRLRRFTDVIFAGLVVLNAIDHFISFTDWPGTGLWRFNIYLPANKLYLFLVGIVFYEMRTQTTWRHWLMLSLCLTSACINNKSWTILGLVICGAVILLLATRERLPILASRWLLYLGTISYSLYLLHQFIGYAVIKQSYHWGWNGHVGVLVAITVSILLATAVCFGVERPINDLIKNKYRQP